MNASYSLEFPEPDSRSLGILYIICVRTKRAPPPNLQILAHYLWVMYVQLK